MGAIPGGVDGVGTGKGLGVKVGIGVVFCILIYDGGI